MATAAATAAAVASAPPSLAFGVSPARCGPHGGNFGRDRLFFVRTSSSKPSPGLTLVLPPRSSSSVASARRRKNSSATTAAPLPPSSKTQKDLSNKEKKSVPIDDSEEVDIDEDAFEALFSQLEEDLKNDNFSDYDSDDEITEEDLAKLEQELEDALGDENDDELSGTLYSDPDNLDDSDEDEEDYKPPKLKNWQLRRLASALKIGRRKTSIKNLSAELGLDRALVLELLRDPPPNLLLMSVSLPDKVVEAPSEPQSAPAEPPSMLAVDVAETEPVSETQPKEEVPVHVMQTRWSMKKRLKKVQVETLERVYIRTKRPTDAMIGSIVHVTNLPKKTVVKWFEDKRAQYGVPEHHQPFRRSPTN